MVYKRTPLGRSYVHVQGAGFRQYLRNGANTAYNSAKKLFKFFQPTIEQASQRALVKGIDIAEKSLKSDQPFQTMKAEIKPALQEQRKEMTNDFIRNMRELHLNKYTGSGLNKVQEHRIKKILKSHIVNNLSYC
jgi:hypothetical protein